MDLFTLAIGMLDEYQVFTKEGRFVKEIFTGRDTPMRSWLASGFTFSRDPEQKYLIVTDGTNQCVRILNRKDGSQVTRFGTFGDTTPDSSGPT